VAALASVDALTILDDDRPLSLLLRWSLTSTSKAARLHEHVAALRRGRERAGHVPFGGCSASTPIALYGQPVKCLGDAAPDVSATTPHAARWLPARVERFQRGFQNGWWLQAYQRFAPFLSFAAYGSGLLPGYFRLFLSGRSAHFSEWPDLGALKPRMIARPLGIPYVFAVLNAAAVAALRNFLRRNTRVWTT
jgi:hypothetical protein